ncbi:hypothetical protein BCR34DRAFT_600204 [Clohesyomyces aquaticus]|uniref:Uncharacterized protein n=1 Tax=Clohesyomyces aquaticus TaxID=1231657 RepID=A0A1Y1ZSS3_9PLEO|nr:hypothetical protein BCR34DRAFT_600204 [Clohesyomyces aquaticus]
MSATTSRRTSRRGSETPPTSNPPRTPTSNDPANYAVEPKSEYLRSALAARRAKDVPVTPARVEPQLLERPPSAASTVDPWLDHAENEEEVPKATPIRRSRRPSEVALPRGQTYRDVQANDDKREKQVWDLSMKLQLLRDQNNELKGKVEAYEKRIQELEHLEQENLDLREDCDRLQLELQDMDVLEDENKELKDQNEEILKIQEETVSEMTKLQSGMEEAADLIFRLDAENTELKKENQELKIQAEHVRTNPDESTYYSTDNDSSPPRNYPQRVYSVDESRPSTSNFDSDYYSQPASPQVLPRKASKKFSEHAKKFQELNQTGQYALEGLKKRASEVSMTSRRRSVSPPPKMPEIPESILKASEPKTTKRLTKQNRSQGSQPAPIKTVLEKSSRPSTGSSAPRTPTTFPTAQGGLRELYHIGQPERRRPSSSSHQSHPTAFHRPNSRTPDNKTPTALYPPPRHSSRFAHTSSSEEKLRSGQPLTESDDIPAPSSVMSEDLTTEVDPREQWWKKDKRLENPGARNLFGAPPLTRSLTDRGRPDAYGSNFLFNPTESEDEFIRKTSGRGR